ncbi:hypothetical protein G6F40_018046 [Rhizopus arrhizus]|nr:hypothetical protein G6F40_018046 [Rhizopus arrhizus]
MAVLHIPVGQRQRHHRQGLLRVHDGDQQGHGRRGAGQPATAGDDSGTLEERREHGMDGQFGAGLDP